MAADGNTRSACEISWPRPSKPPDPARLITKGKCRASASRASDTFLKNQSVVKASDTTVLRALTIRQTTPQGFFVPLDCAEYCATRADFHHGRRVRRILTESS